jgi:hypothetical protein
MRRVVTDRSAAVVVADMVGSFSGGRSPVPGIER